MTAIAIRRRRLDRTAVLVSLAATAAIGWTITIRLVDRTGMSLDAMDMAPGVATSGAHLPVATAMWAAMMVGMMVPSATPMVVAYSDWARRSPTRMNRPASVASFLAGYVLVWSGFSVLAATFQVALERIDVLTGMGALRDARVGGAALVAAGIFQMTPWKEACLGRCRTPVGFLISEWRDGARGAAIMGARHGAYCLGCCWALMAVLFAVGTMHLGWMAAIAGFVLAEKVAPRSLRLAHAAAALLVSWGAWTIVTSGA